MARPLLGAFFLVAGLMHFLKPKPYVAIVPDVLPRKREIVYVSGVAEIAGGALVLPERTRRAAGWWLIATLLAVFPANVNMAVNAERFRSVPGAAAVGAAAAAGAADRVGVAGRGAMSGRTGRRCSTGSRAPTAAASSARREPRGPPATGCSSGSAGSARPATCSTSTTPTCRASRT